MWFERRRARAAAGAPESGGGAAALLSVRELAVRPLGAPERPVVASVSFDVEQGETLAVVGESGSGKSLTAKAIMGLLPEGLEAAGDVRYRGRSVIGLGARERQRLRGADLGMVLQDPFTSLNPLRRCGDQIVELLRDRDGGRLGREARRAEAARRLEEVGLDADVADQHPFQLSGGMRQRVAIAAALAGDPSVLIADEPATALDVTTQAAILALLSRLCRERGMGLVLITHDLRVAFSVSDRIVVLYSGTLLEEGPASVIHEEPLHPYTLGLLRSEPPTDRRTARLFAIPGSVPRAHTVLERCAFADRCQWAHEACRAERPPLRAVSGDRLTACLRVEQIRDEMRAIAPATVDAEADLGAASDAEVLIAVESVSKRFGRSTRRGAAAEHVQALTDVSLALRAGESVGIVGESGSGKTTLARCLMGLETPDSGRIEIGGVDASDYRALTRAQRSEVRAAVQMVFQDPYSSLNPSVTIGAALGEAVRHAGVAQRRDARTETARLLELVGLDPAYAGRRPEALSGGERQRVAIARALAVRPRVLVCDEAVSALDVSIQAQIINVLLELRERLGLSYVFITHDLAVLRQVAERAIVLYRGEIVESGSVETILDRPAHPYTQRLVSSIPGRLALGSHAAPRALAVSSSNHQERNR